MFDSIQYRKEHRNWQKKYNALAPKVGETAPDFELRDTNGDNPIRLSSFLSNKPVALIFGSFTWPPYVEGTVNLQDLYKKYHDQVQFLIIYIREAHPVDGWWFGGGIMGLLLKLRRSKAATDVYDPKTLEERQVVANRCEIALKYDIPTYIDEMDDAVSKAYAAMPTRLYLIGLDGKVVYAGGLGPFGFKPKELESAIKKYLA